MKSVTKRISNSKGFTLIEIAIVLVIIGLLLGGVLKGQELIENSKIKKAANDMDGVTSAYNGYIDRYKRFPGDDGPLATLIARGGNWATITRGGNNNGLIVALAANTFLGVAQEGDGFWVHLKAAGFLTGNPLDVGVAALPRNAFGGLMGVTSDPVMPAGVGGLQGNKICLSQVPGKAAAALDVQYDDGVANTGTIRATLGTVGINTPPGAAAAATYDEAQVYTICRTL
jgi:prepilin-type N-terminal cleavage/methylation domain-containing protein